MAVLSELITHEKPLVTAASAVYTFKPSLERRYRFVSRFGDEVLLHRLDPDNGLIHLPRALCPVGIKDERAFGAKVDFPHGPSPLPHQVAIFKEIAATVSAGLSGLVVAGTGTGKTAMGFHAAFTLQRKALVITTKDDIYKQWIDRACGLVSASNPEGVNMLGLQPHEVGEIRGDKCEVLGTKFVVAMIHSLSKSGKYPPWIVDDFGLVLFDECHRVPADQFSAVADMFPARVRLGLSATPERKDGKDLLVRAHIGPVRARLERELMVPKVLRYNSAWECPRVFRRDKASGETKVVRLPHEAGKTTHLEKILAADPARNHFLGELIATAFHKGRQLVVFSTLHDHLKAMHRICRDAYGISGRQMGFYIGTTSKHDEEQRERDKVKPILFTTYSMMGEGTDLPWLDACLLTMPRSSVEQPVGRIRREYPDKAQSVVIDVADFDSPVFAGYAHNRARWYEKIGAVVKQMN
ncbi:DEAD/DEAH box helicase [Sinorhizobium fredii]|uniref:DEAD/DEAH box helicase n=1 Tax=Rhizobium fredii TaxID=380 RepID=UPI001294FCD3|nr:DEAD/DEAH box helicase family protein [Sinorhizobium fredii]MQW94078.1 hypothetical protein [Sinorhizobium fredii]